MSGRHSYGYALAGWGNSLAVLLISLNTGCHWQGMYAAGGCGSCNTPIIESCDSCGGGCGGDCGGSVGSFPATCGNCPPSNCGFSGLMLPLLHSNLGCGSGCGDVYWGEWISNPPECCDACNEGGCWAGSSCDGSYAGYHDGYGCGTGLLAGPVAVIRGTYLGVTHVLRGTASVLHCGYRSTCGYPYGPLHGGCANGCCESVSTGCESCGDGACTGGCAQATGVVQPRYVRSTPATGSGVRTARAESRIATTAPPSQVKPAQRIARQRLRR